MLYVKNRFKDIVNEMKNRNFATNFDKLNFTNIPEEAFHDYEVTLEDVKINLDRILLRIEKQPSWYKYYGKNIKDWNTFYEELSQSGNLIHKH